MLKQAKREAALHGLRTYRAELEAEIRQLVGPLQDELVVIDKAIKALGGATEQLDSIPASMSGISGDGPQAVVVDFLRQHPGQMFKPSVAAKLILARGYKPRKPKLWATQVRTVMTRAVEKGIAEEGMDRDGKKTFGLKREGDTE